MLKAMELLNGKVELWILGLFSPKELEKEIKQYLEKEYIKYLGFVPPFKMYSLMKSADIGLINFWPEPNHILALPSKIFEYMAAGLPIIVSDFPLWKEIIQQNKCGLAINPLSPKEIANAVKYLIDNLLESKIMGQRGKKAILDKYNWEKETQQLIAIYKDLLA